MIELLIVGIGLGLYAGLSPGPLLVLVISHALQHGYKEGVKVALAPVVTDIPIIFLSVIFLSIVSNFSYIIGFISMLGGIYLGYLAYESFHTSGLKIKLDVAEPKSLKKGITVNLLNPGPYIFWITVGGPILINAYKESVLSPFIFIIGFYTLLIGSKIVLAYITGRSRDFLTGKYYMDTMRILGFVLSVFALYLIYEGLHIFGLVS